MYICGFLNVLLCARIGCFGYSARKKTFLFMDVFPKLGQRQPKCSWATKFDPKIASVTPLSTPKDCPLTLVLEKRSAFTGVAGVDVSLRFSVITSFEGFWTVRELIIPFKMWKRLVMVFQSQGTSLLSGQARQCQRLPPPADAPSTLLLGQNLGLSQSR